LDDTIQDCVDAMGFKDVRHLPCCDPETGEIIGLLSIRDLAKALAREREKAFRKLEKLSNTMPIHDG
jgi:CBS domain-containing protein